MKRRPSPLAGWVRMAAQHYREDVMHGHRMPHGVIEKLYSGGITCKLIIRL